MPSRSKPRRAVIVEGTRTPFVKAFGDLMELDTIALGKAATEALLRRAELPRKELDAIVWGGVLLPGLAPNLAREIALDLKLIGVEGHTVTRACASGLQACVSAAATIERGDADVIIAGGSDSTSNAEVALPQKLIHALAPLAFGKAQSPADVIGVLANMMPISEVLPKMPKIAERTTGEVMGKACERMAIRNEISREDQDAFAARSHHRAAAAIASGRFDREVAPVQSPRGKWVHSDGMVRADTSVEKLSKLRPVFSRTGTLTAGNASGLTDGAAAVLIMEESKARALGYTPLAAIKTWAFAAVDPGDQLLIGPAISMPMALDKAGITLADCDLIDIHEAFAAQVLCVIKMLESDAWARHRLGRDQALGEVDTDKLNVHGGSVSIGHPFGATGARMITTMANELVERDANHALIGICAAGGIGGSAVLERI